jgi:hypothetical protein
MEYLFPKFKRTGDLLIKYLKNNFKELNVPY